jgi:hypothetical protein
MKTIQSSAGRRSRHRARQEDVLAAVIDHYAPSAVNLGRATRSGIIAAQGEIQANGPGSPVVAAAPAYPHPLGPPVVSGTNITVDMMLNQPTRITRMLSDLTLQRFIADRVFASAGGVTGGAVIYEEQTLNELYTTRDIERVEPGMETPILSSERPVPKVAQVEKWGGKLWISDEARDRNNTASFTNAIRRLGNTVVRKLNQRAIEVLEASIVASGQTVVGRNWSAYAGLTPNTTAFNAGPLRDFALARQMAEEDELGVEFTLWLINPQEYTNLVVGAGGPANFQALLQSMNFTVYVSNRVAPGTAYVVAGTQTGEMRIEKPLSTATWREEGRERTWVQATVRPVMYVTNPYSVLKFTGLAG